MEFLHITKSLTHNICKQDTIREFILQYTSKKVPTTAPCSLVLLNFKGAALVVLPVPAPHG